MKYFVPLLVLALCAAKARPAESRSVTFYSDGAVVEMEATAAKGSIEIALPASMIEGSLRIKPGIGSSIQRVDVDSARMDSGRG